MGTLGGFQNPPAMGSGELGALADVRVRGVVQSAPPPDAIVGTFKSSAP